MSTPEELEGTGSSAWVLKPITEIPGVRHALIMTLDGMVTATSENLTRDVADGIGAMTSAMYSSSRAAINAALEAPVSTPLKMVTAQTDWGTYMVMPVGGDTNILISAAGDANMPMGVVAHTLARQAMKLGNHMSVSARTGDGAS
ncbi:roadblock/LC7 domain-containing protein [Streptomyces sp. NPDC002917]|uniref:roadblock/LC7 domain-containing protein n=1 Tax=Streptomyces sp. NPDC002917 TaxID=3364671 RepID=UPI003683E7AD